MSDKDLAIRRLLGIGGMICVILLLVSIVFYTLQNSQGGTIVIGGHAFSFKDVFFSEGTPTPSPTPCSAPVHQSGDSNGTLNSGGLQRKFLLHLPASYSQRLYPLVIAYHGYSWTMQQMERTSRFDVQADSAGFIVVYPQGVDDPPSWNAGVGAYGPTGDADDIQFTRDLLSYLEKNYCVNPHRVYLTGFSLGGGMAYRLACVLSDQIAAVATVSGAYYPFGDCHTSRPLPVMEVHGVADTMAPYEGNSDAHMAAVQDYLNGWLERDKCNGDGKTFYQQGDVTGIEWTACAGGSKVVHYRISDGKHAWNQTQVIDTATVVWQFLSQFSH